MTFCFAHHGDPRGTCSPSPRSAPWGSPRPALRQRTRRGVRVCVFVCACLLSLPHCHRSRLSSPGRRRCRGQAAAASRSAGGRRPEAASIVVNQQKRALLLRSRSATPGGLTRCCSLAPSAPALAPSASLSPRVPYPYPHAGRRRQRRGATPARLHLLPLPRPAGAGHRFPPFFSAWRVTRRLTCSPFAWPGHCGLKSKYQADSTTAPPLPRSHE